MKKYLNIRVFTHILVCLSINLITAFFNKAEGRITPRKTISYGDSYGALRNQGQLRTYYLHAPKFYNSKHPMPLVLVFHGDGGSGRSIAAVSRFNTLAEQKGFIVVYPNGINHKWSLRGNSKTKVDDISFVTALIDHLQQIRNIDSRRIYATGFSRGGILTQALACKLPDKIAAFASVAGSLPVRFKPVCQPQTPVSMLMINGTNDLAVHYEGDDNNQRGALISIPETVNFWRTHDQCSSTQFRLLPNSNPSRYFHVKTSHYSGCNSGSEILSVAVVNGGHSWPGGASQSVLNKSNTKLGFNASKMIWNFFQRHSLP